MEKELERSISLGELSSIYVIRDTALCGINKSIAYYFDAKILKIDKQSNSIFVYLPDCNSYEIYSFEDFGRLLFESLKSAYETASKVPEPGDTMYQVIGNKVLSRTVADVEHTYQSGMFDLFLHLKGGINIPIKEIGSSIFFKKADAKAKVNNK